MNRAVDTGRTSWLPEDFTWRKLLLAVGPGMVAALAGADAGGVATSVSYTHLTLPTKA